MPDQIIAYCGLVCSDCAALLATQINDTEKLKALALEWYGEENNSTLCICDGCTTAGRKNKHCSECGVHICASDRGVVNCAHCPDYACATLTELFEFIPDTKTNLEAIRAAL